MILFSFLFISSLLSLRKILHLWTQNQQTDIDERNIAESNPDDQLCSAIQTINMPKPDTPLGQLQSSSGDASDHDSVVLVMSDNPSPPTEDEHVQIPDFKTEFKIATSLITISGGVIVAVLAALVLPENKQPVITHKVVFKMFTSLNYISLVSAVFLFLLTLKRPNIQSLVTLVRLTMWISIAALTCALGFATCLVLPKSVEVIPILVVPLVLILFIMILVCCCCPRK